MTMKRSIQLKIKIGLPLIFRSKLFKHKSQIFFNVRYSQQVVVFVHGDLFIYKINAH